MKLGYCLLAVCCVAVWGCEKSGPAGESSGASANASGAKKKVVYIPKSAGNPYFVPLTAGVKEAVEAGGFEFSTVAPESTEPTSQISVIKDQIQQGVSAIVLSPNSPIALNPVLDEAKKKGIAVVTVDCDLTDNETHRDLCVLPTDPEQIGKGQVEMISTLMGGKGKFAILSATADAPNQNKWIEVMKKTLDSDPKYKDLKLTEVVYGNDDPQKSLTESESLLNKDPELRGIVAPTSVGLASCAQALETTRKAKSVQLTGLGTPDQLRKYVNNGTVKTFALWDPHDEGFVAGIAAIGLANKSLQPKEGVEFESGKLGKMKVGTKTVVIAGPPLIFTKDNIANFKF